MILDEKLNSGDVIVLDGAVGSEIERLGGKMDLASWCATANLTDPDKVRHVHEAYIKAGTDVITTNTFATCRHVLDASGLGDETVNINRRAVELAAEAKDKVAPDRPVAIAGSMSNNMAWLPGSVGADPDFAPSREQEAANYREMADTLAEAGCDLLIMEMLLDTYHGCRVLEAALATGLPVWAGISTSQGPNGQMVGWDQSREETEDRLPDGFEQGTTETLEELIDAFSALNPAAIGIMHSSMESTTLGLELLFERWDGPVMAYPETIGYDAVNRQSRGPVTPENYALQCREWVGSGVQIIGGCCGTTIYHIQAMVDKIPSRTGSRFHATA